ncbi:MAG: DUF4340 domain-containing protein [Proteobacteria bacterium]|nr:DUF4340 domain-containing protein [Pseudomonadota bacterium]MDA1022859.1 DUF4340 domain-containing protein [Pseudomonadota bacterium]
MSPRTFTFIAVATAIAFALAAFSLGRDRGYQPVAGTGDKVFPDLLARVNDVTRLVVDGPNGKITLTKDENKWALKESDGYAGRTIKIRRAILGLAQLRLLEAKTRKKENYSKLGLQDRDAKTARSKRVRLFDAKDVVLADLLVGAVRKAPQKGKASGGVYVRRASEAQTWLGSDNASDFDSEKKDWLERKIIDIKAAQVKRMVIIHPGGETLTLSKASPETPQFTLENIPQGKKLIDPASLSTVGGGLADLQLDVVRNGPVPFVAARTITTDVTTFDGLSVRMLTTQIDGNTWMTLDATGATPGDASASDKASAIMKRTGGWVYQISKYAASNLTKKPGELMEDIKPKS